MHFPFRHHLLKLLKLLLFLCSPLIFLGCTNQSIDTTTTSTNGEIMDSETELSTTLNLTDDAPETAVSPTTPATVSPSQKMPQEQFVSEITGITYPVDVYLPEGYPEAHTPFPVIYALDGQWSYDGYVDILREKETAVILVSIHQGPGDRRATDYLLPGAGDYYQFLTTELIPHIEEQYKIDPHKRTLVGVSYGGMFVSSALLMEAVGSPYFHKYVSADAPFLYTHRRETIALEEERYQKSPAMPARLLLTSALLNADLGPFDADVTDFQTRLEERGYGGLEITRKAYQVNHYDVGTPTFADAIDLFFE